MPKDIKGNFKSEKLKATKLWEISHMFGSKFISPVNGP